MPGIGGLSVASLPRSMPGQASRLIQAESNSWFVPGDDVSLDTIDFALQFESSRVTDRVGRGVQELG